MHKQRRVRNLFPTSMGRQMSRHFLASRASPCLMTQKDKCYNHKCSPFLLLSPAFMAEHIMPLLNSAQLSQPSGSCPTQLTCWEQWHNEKKSKPPGCASTAQEQPSHQGIFNTSTYKFFSQHHNTAVKKANLSPEAEYLSILKDGSDSSQKILLINQTDMERLPDRSNRVSAGEGDTVQFCHRDSIRPIANRTPAL